MHTTIAESISTTPNSIRYVFTASSDSLFHPPLSRSCLLLPVFLLSCLLHVIMPLSSVVCHPPSFLRVLPTVVCSSSVSLSSSSALLSCLPSLLSESGYFSFVVVCAYFAAVVVFRSVPKFPFRTGSLCRFHKSAHHLAL